jgi:hypothetical protein
MKRRRAAPTVLLLCGFLVAGGLAACATVTSVPPDSRLAGTWRLERTASDDAEAKISAVIASAEAKLRERLAKLAGRTGAAARSGGAATPDLPDTRYDSPGDIYGGPGRVGPDFPAVRARLRQALVPPAQLRIETRGESLRLTDDDLPSRDYRLGEKLSRLDENGAAVVEAEWDHGAFVLSSRYNSHVTRRQSYQTDAAGSALTVQHDFYDPAVGRVLVKSVYRRTGV